MAYQIGDTVIHWNYGPGKIIGLDQKKLGGETRSYYVVEINQLKIWVPVGGDAESSIRLPTPSSEFKTLISILRGPAAQMPDNQFQRQAYLVERMRNKTLNAVCHVISDLTARSRTQKLTRNDQAVLKKATGLLIDEWEISLGTPRENAQKELESLLHPTAQ